MGFVVGLVLGIILGFAGGFLFYRNNTGKLKAGEQLLRKEDK